MKRAVVVAVMLCGLALLADPARAQFWKEGDAKKAELDAVQDYAETVMHIAQENSITGAYARTDLDAMLLDQVVMGALVNSNEARITSAEEMVALAVLVGSENSATGATLTEAVALHDGRIGSNEVAIALRPVPFTATNSETFSVSASSTSDALTADAVPGREARLEYWRLWQNSQSTNLFAESAEVTLYSVSEHGANARWKSNPTVLMSSPFTAAPGSGTNLLHLLDGSDVTTNALLWLSGATEEFVRVYAIDGNTLTVDALAAAHEATNVAARCIEAFSVSCMPDASGDFPFKLEFDAAVTNSFSVRCVRH